MKPKKTDIIYPTEKECTAKIDWCGLFKEYKSRKRPNYDLTNNYKKNKL